MRMILPVMALLILSALSVWAQPTEIDTFLVAASGDTNRFWAWVPENYNPASPPAIVVWWHELGGNQYEPRDRIDLVSRCSARGWLVASHLGPNNHHWNTRKAQAQCQEMLDFLRARYPFSMDSVYMAGASMGGAAGQVWHVNHCGISDYLIAASAGGSQILDCALRQQQYLDSIQVNNSMQEAFGGLPHDNDSVAFEYHRASAIVFSDTAQSMHFNALHLPVYNTWGTGDSTWNSEWFAYGHPAQRWDTIRSAGNADFTVAFCSGLAGHGYFIMNPDSIVNWLAGFSVNRYPNDISINADESGEYYWTRVAVFNNNQAFGRYGVTRDYNHRRLDINLVRNIWTLDVEFAFPWSQFDSLSGDWINLDSAAIPAVGITFSGVPYVRDVRDANGDSPPFAYGKDTLRMILLHGSHYTVLFGHEQEEAQRTATPRDCRVVMAYPNPFNSELNLEIETPLAGRQEIRLYDVTGRVAKTILATFSPGVQRLAVSGEGLASGVYFVVVPKSGRTPLKVVLLK
jgi:hypothetical protein